MHVNVHHATHDGMQVPQRIDQKTNYGAVE